MFLKSGIKVKQPSCFLCFKSIHIIPMQYQQIFLENEKVLSDHTKTKVQFLLIFRNCKSASKYKKIKVFNLWKVFCPSQSKLFTLSFNYLDQLLNKLVVNSNMRCIIYKIYTGRILLEIQCQLGTLNSSNSSWSVPRK